MKRTLSLSLITVAMLSLLLFTVAPHHHHAGLPCLWGMSSVFSEVESDCCCEGTSHSACDLDCSDQCSETCVIETAQIHMPPRGGEEYSIDDTLVTSSSLSFLAAELLSLLLDSSKSLEHTPSSVQHWSTLKIPIPFGLRAPPSQRA